MHTHWDLVKQKSPLNSLGIQFFCKFEIRTNSRNSINQPLNFPFTVHNDGLISKKEGLSKVKITTIAAFIRSLWVILKDAKMRGLSLWISNLNYKK